MLSRLESHPTLTSLFRIVARDAVPAEDWPPNPSAAANAALEEALASFGVVEGAVFSLRGLLVACTFLGAASRFDSRRQLVLEEANAIGTALDEPVASCPT